MKKSFSSKVSNISPSIFSIMTNLSNKYNAINLSQGFPDFPGPDFIKNEAIKAILQDYNQYVPSIGIPEFREAISNKYKQFYNLDYDPETEITVFSGATEALYSTLTSILEPNDEVILFEPCYDAYVAVCNFNYAVPKFIRLQFPDFKIERDMITKAFTNKTKCVIINTPNNPTTRVYTKQELDLIGELCLEYDCFIITDEVYEHITFNTNHLPIASIKKYKDRIITISSTAKTFSLTGWKVGYSLAKESITKYIRNVHQFVTFCTPGPFQYAMAKALNLQPNDTYFKNLKRDYHNRLKFLNMKLLEVGFKIIPSEGTYYIVADITPFGFNDDLKFCEFLIKEIGVAAIPMSAFYFKDNKLSHLVRFCFSKKIENLEAAGKRLEKLKDFAK